MTKRTVFSLLPLLALTLPASLPAQEDGAQALDEIIVTAQRREQTLQDVPISITAFSAEQIERSNFKGARDFLEMTPNVAFTANDQQGNKNGDISIRGLGDLTNGGNERLIQSRPTIGYFVDDFSTAFVASGSANPPLDDIERIEVLRGPQGTYFGRNATGGAINVISKKPDENGMAKVRLAVGNHGGYEYGLIGNVPINDELFARGGAAFTSSDGYVDNLHPTGNDTGYDNLNMRAAVRWKPGDWTIDLAGQYIEEEDHQQARIPSMSGPAGFLFNASGGPVADAPTCGLGDSIFAENGNTDKMCEDQPGYTDVENLVLTAKLEYLGSRFGITAITGMIDSDMYQYEDIDNSGMDFFNRISDYESESISQEVRLFSTEPLMMGATPVQWMVGAIAYDDEAQVNNTIISGADVIEAGRFPGGGPLGATTPGDHPNENEITVQRDGFAAFFDLGFEVTDAVTVSVSGRYSSDDDRQFWQNTYASFACGRRAVVDGVPAPFLENCALQPEQDVLIYTGPNGAQFTSGGRFDQTVDNPYLDTSNDGSNFSPRVALNWNYSDDASAYATVSTGYRAPGARTAPDGVSRTGGPSYDPRSRFDEETVTNYEIGWKTFLNNRRTQVEAAVFRMDWEDMQVRLAQTRCTPGQEIVPSPADCPPNGTGFAPLNVVANADSASSQGLEISTQTLVGDSITLMGAIGFMDAKFDSFTNAPQGDVSGEELPSAPETTASVSGQYDWEANGFSGYVRLTANYRSEMVARFSDIPASVFPRVSPSATILNLQAGLDWSNHSLTLNVSNLLDEDYYSGVDSFSHSGAVTTPGGQFVNLAWTMTADF
ncbi:MAG: TonB-dependent receptor [Gammaproteobacteria bacterium]|nr:TonB-dependent receptor [Gammaproteobacteria bacterium]